MLNRRENEVMKRIYALCKDGGVCLITPDELIAGLPKHEKWTEEQLEKTLEIFENAGHGICFLEDYKRYERVLKAFIVRCENRAKERGLV